MFEHREALTGAPTAQGVYKQEFTVQGGKYIVRHWTSREALLRDSSGCGTWSVSPQYRDLRTRDLDKRKGASDIMFTRLSDTEKVSNIVSYN